MYRGESSTPATSAPQVHLSAVNASGSAYGLFVFSVHFFEQIQLMDTELFECLVHIKPLLGIVRSRGHIRKCSIATGPPDNVERLAMTLHFDHGVRKHHSLTYEERPCLFPAVDTDSPSRICVDSHLAKEWTDYFLSTGKTGECSFHASPTQCMLRCRIDGPMDGTCTYNTLTQCARPYKAKSKCTSTK